MSKVNNNNYNCNSMKFSKKNLVKKIKIILQAIPINNKYKIGSLNETPRAKL